MNILVIGSYHKKHLCVIKQALNEATLFGMLPANPAAPVRLPKRSGSITGRTVMLNANEAQKIIEAFKEHILLPAVVITLYYGLRRSEVLGLRWSAVDFDNDTYQLTILL